MEGYEEMKYFDFMNFIKMFHGVWLLNVGIQMETHVHTFRIILYVDYNGETLTICDNPIDNNINELTVLGFMNINDIYSDELFCFNDEKYKFEEG